MRAHTNTHPEGPELQPPAAYGTPSPELLARADQGFARFLTQHNEDQDDDTEHTPQ